jgi:hypothetical protein
MFRPFEIHYRRPMSGPNVMPRSWISPQQAADLDRLQGLIAQDGSRIAAIREARQCRIALGRLLGLVDIPTEPTTATLHARKAAQKRWAEVS